MAHYEYAAPEKEGDLPLFRIASDAPSVYIALATNTQDPGEPTGVTLMGVSLDYDALVKGVGERYRKTPTGWDTGEPWPNGRQWDSIYLLEVPQDFPVMEITVKELDDMRKAFERLEHEREERSIPSL